MTEFNLGLRNGLLIYGIGALLTVVTHLITGWDYAHAPPVSFLLILITLIVGLIRFFSTLKGTLTDNSEKAKGELTIHGVLAFLFILFLIWVRFQ